MAYVLPIKEPRTSLAAKWKNVRDMNGGTDMEETRDRGVMDKVYGALSSRHKAQAPIYHARPSM